MYNAVEGLNPEPVWRYFSEISRIPRGSKNEAAIVKYVLDTARKLGLEARADAVGNVIARKPASFPAGRTQRPVALQGHLDMVCEKNRNTKHDFLKDPIKLVRKDDFLTADGTTLGADNGIAVAVNLAIMEDNAIQHGPLELLFTVDEETGLTGAAGLTPDFLESRTLINLDSEEEGVLYTGCAGGKDIVGTWTLPRVEAPENYIAARIEVAGLRGGHSGMDIDKGRGNAIKIMNRALRALTDAVGARLADIDGGDKHNAIPRECEALMWIAPEKIGDAERIIENLCSAVKAEFGAADSDIAITLTLVDTNEKRRVVEVSDQEKLIRTITALPYGVIKMSADIAGLVETSTNPAVIKMEGDKVKIVTFQRSAYSMELEKISEAVAAAFESGGAAVESSESYPGWAPNPNSRILEIARSAFRSLFGGLPKVTAIHAGLECGVIGEKIPGMDMISFGPTIMGVHSPDERLYIEPVERFWNFLLEILKRID